MFDVRFELILSAGFSYSLLNVALWYQSQSDQGNCVFQGVMLCFSCVAISAVWSGTHGLPSLSQVSRQLPIWPNGMSQSVVASVRCMECVFWFYRHVCVWLNLQTCVCECLTFVLWLVIAGNPSNSQSKKTIKQRFLKLLPCCKPSATPSVSQSKCSFTIYTSLLPSMCPASLVNEDEPPYSHTVQKHTHPHKL